MNEIEEAQALVRSVEPGRVGLDHLLATVNTVKRARERKLLVYFVGGLYVFSVGVTIVYLIVRSFCRNEDAFDNIFEIIKVAVIPVVTFVIGYYFASEKAT